MSVDDNSDDDHCSDGGGVDADGDGGVMMGDVLFLQQFVLLFHVLQLSTCFSTGSAKLLQHPDWHDCDDYGGDG